MYASITSADLLIAILNEKHIREMDYSDYLIATGSQAQAPECKDWGRFVPPQSSF
jgi:hypothetical protein